jgi:hypothetical protein
MDNHKLIWGFSALDCEAYSKDIATGIINKEYKVDLDSIYDVIDIALSACKVYILKNSSLWCFNAQKKNTKKYDLVIKTYKGLHSYSKYIFIIGSSSYKFDVGSKLCRKVDIDTKDHNVICKCSLNTDIFILLSLFDKKSNTSVCKYSVVHNTSVSILLKYRLAVFTGAGSAVYNNFIYVFGGKYDQGWSSNESIRISLDTYDMSYMSDLIKPGIFNMTSVYTDGDKLGILDSVKSLHMYDLARNKWTIKSDRIWNKRKAALWAWKISQLYSMTIPLHKLPLSIVRKTLTEYL